MSLEGSSLWSGKTKLSIFLELGIAIELGFMSFYQCYLNYNVLLILTCAPTKLILLNASFSEL